MLATAFTQAPKLPSVDQYTNGDKLIYFRGRMYDGRVNWWLTIDALNGEQWKKDGYSVTTTRLFSKYKPAYRAINGGYEVGFLKP